MLGGLIILTDSLSTSLGIGLSITLKAGVEWQQGAVVQWSEHLSVAKAGGSGFNPQRLPWVFSLPAGSVTNVDSMKDLWYSSTVWLL